MPNRKVDGNRQYARCADCKTLRSVRRIEWSRAAQPRCYACGGRLDQCKPKSKSVKMDSLIRTAAAIRLEMEKEKRESGA